MLVRQLRLLLGPENSFLRLFFDLTYYLILCAGELKYGICHASYNCVIIKRNGKTRGLKKGLFAMTINEYQALAMRTLNPALDKKDVLINGVMGLCGESGEAIDIVKKHLAQGHALDRNALIKELGDVAWYLAETAYALDVSLEEVMQRNIDKLKVRYPQGFETERSLHRE